MSPLIKRECLASLRQPGFVAVLAIMAVAAIGMNTAIGALGLQFKKERVELSRDINAIPEQLGPWVMVTDSRYNGEVEHALATSVYINRQYVDSRLISKKEIDELKKIESMLEREAAVARLRNRTPKAVINFHIPYYTGMADTVAHVPERCYVGSGFDPENPATIRLPVFDTANGRNPNLEMRYVEFRDRGRPELGVQNVAYTFQVNGAYSSDSLGGVRARMQDIFQKHVYYAKIELMVQVGDDTKLAQSMMTDFLKNAMPEIEKCLPDWKAVTGQEPDLNKDN